MYYLESLGAAIVICAILGICGGIFLYAWFLNKNNKGKYTGFVGWLYDFLHFKEMLVEVILKVTYLILACTLTLTALAILFFSDSGSIGINFIGFLIFVIFGNLALRLTYEFSMIILVICRNTTEINKKLGGGAAADDTVTNPFKKADAPVSPPPPPPSPKEE